MTKSPPTHPPRLWFRCRTADAKRLRRFFLSCGAMTNKFSKPPLTFAQQLQVLTKRGLVVRDSAKAIDTLSRISYYRLSGYWLHSSSRTTHLLAEVLKRRWRSMNSIGALIPAAKNGPAWVGIENKRVYAVLCLLRQLTRGNHAGKGWLASACALLHEMDGHPRWERSMGMPEAWATHEFWTA